MFVFVVVDLVVILVGVFLVEDSFSRIRISSVRSSTRFSISSHTSSSTKCSSKTSITRINIVVVLILVGR